MFTKTSTAIVEYKNKTISRMTFKKKVYNK